MFQKFVNALFGSQNERDLKELFRILEMINAKEKWALGLENAEFPVVTESFRRRCAEGESLDSLLPEAFALAREAGRRALGERLYDVQLLGAIVLHQGKIMEMKTGEGKTIACVPAAYLNALAGQGVHIVTVNDYLASRDAEWMGPIYSLLGVSVGVIVSQMDNDARRGSYRKDITYGTNNELGFDYLRDNINPQPDIAAKVQRAFSYCIVDEIDSILIDEARTPLIISGMAADDTSKFYDVNKLVGSLSECPKNPDTGEYPDESQEQAPGDFKIDEKDKRIIFTDQGINKIEALLLQRNMIHDSLYTDQNFEYIHYFTQALRAHKLFHKDVEYVVNESKVEIVDEFTGRILHGRRYSDGLHQAIEAKENIRIAQRNQTLATITFQNFFKMYAKLAGMTGTADTEAREFAKIYNLSVVIVPTNRPVIRTDEDDLIYVSEECKFNAIVEEISRAHEAGQPMLVGTVSIEKSEKLSMMLTRKGIRHEVLNAKNHGREAMIIAEAGAEGSVTIATNMAGRGTDIKLGGNPEFRARRSAGTQATDDEYKKVYAVEFAKWRKEYEKVKDLGGLYVLGTERHESRRIDNQLRGRSGRQGDPGRSRFFISLDDDLMRLFGGENLKNLMSRLGMEEDKPLFHPMVNRSIERAQKKVEEKNFDIRKHLLEYDDVLNQQRKFIFQQRDDILRDEKLAERVLNSGHDILEAVVVEHEKRKSDADAVALLEQSVKENFNLPLGLSAPELKAMSPDALGTYLGERLEADIREKQTTTGEKTFNLLVRIEYLRSIDFQWQQHLDAMEALKEAVALRSYGQKNPLVEYKIEGSDLFEEMIGKIRNSVAKKIIMIRIIRQDGKSFLVDPSRMRGPAMQASHSSMGLFAGQSSGTPPARIRIQSPGGRIGPPGQRPQAPVSQGAHLPTATIRRTEPKVGRNDPCPCGSGKKYKYCHGR